MPAESQSLKRPRGLLKSKKAGQDGDRTAKRQKTDHVVESAEECDKVLSSAEKKDVDIEDWQDLKELHHNAIEAYESSDPSSSVPLLRGIIHECDRFIRHNYIPHSAIPQESPYAFRTIHGTALYLMGDLIAQDNSLVSSGEPANPTDYFEAALELIAPKDSPPPTQPTAPDYWCMRFWLTLGSLQLAILVTDLITEENRDADSEGSAFECMLEVGTLLSRASGSIPDNGHTPDDDSADTDSISMKAINSAIEAYLYGVESYFQANAEQTGTLLQWIYDYFSAKAKIEPQSIDPDLNSQTLKGRSYLIGGSAWAEDCESGIETGDEEIFESRAAVAGRVLLVQATTSFEGALKMAEEVAQDRPDPMAESNLDDIKSLLAEALLTLANLTQSESDRNDLFRRAKLVGVDVDEEDEDEDEDESERDEEGRDDEDEDLRA